MMDDDGGEFVNTTDLFIKEDPTSNLGLMAAKIALYNFQWRFITLIMFNSAHAIGLQTFLMRYDKSVIVKFKRFVPNQRVPVPQFVIFGEEANEISSTIRWLVKVKYDSSSKFVIICASHSQECDEKKIFQTLRSFLILNVVLLKSSHLNSKPLAYSYRIVSSSKCLDDVPYRVNLISNCFDDECYQDLFPERLANFHKCRLIMSTVEQPPFMYLHNGTQHPSGTDGDIMKLAAEMLNATLILQTPGDGSSDWGHYRNDNWTGSLGDIYNTKVHVSVCTAPLSANKYGNFQISFTYYSMDMVWAAKLPTEKAPWEKLLRPLNLRVRILLLFTFIGIIVINTLKETKLWRKLRKVFQIGSSRYNLLFYSWLLFIGLPILKIPKKNSLRIALFTWIWSCFIIRCAYQAALIHSLKYPSFLDNIERFQDVLDDDRPFGGFITLRDYYYEDQAIYNNWQSVNSGQLFKTLDEILNGATDFVLAANKETIKHHLMKDHGMKQLQIIPEKIVNSPTAVYLKKYSPITTPLNYVLRVALEGGFIQRCYQRYLDQDSVIFRRYQTERLESLSMHHFAGCFVLLTVGWIISIVYFAVEYICGNLQNK